MKLVNTVAVLGSSRRFHPILSLEVWSASAFTLLSNVQLKVLSRFNYTASITVFARVRGRVALGTIFLCLVASLFHFQLMSFTFAGIDWDPDWLRCKTEEEILADLNLLRRITSRIRILSLVDCHQGELVLKLAQTLGFQIFLGLWVGPDPGVVQNEINELKRLIQSQPSQFSPSTNYVLGVSVGSEALYRKDVTLEDIIDYKDEVKSALVDANLSEVPVTIVDISNTYVGLPTLREEVDVIMMNNFPFWEPGLIQNPDLAPSFMADTRLAPITSWAEQNNKEWILGETGWSAGGFDKGSNVASPENQLSFFQAFFCLASDRGWSYFWFTGFDNDWRVAQSIAEGEDGNTVEGQFGLFYSNRTLKEHFQSLDFSCPFPASGVRYYFDVNSTLPTTQAPASTSTEFPSSAPTSSTEFPSSAPTSSTAQPTAAVTVAPTEAPTEKPTTAMPSHVPTMTPTEGDTLPPSMVPTLIPDSTSTPNDTLNPTNQPTIRKTVSPTLPPSPSSESNNTPGNLISASFRTQPWGGTSIVGIWGIVFGFSIVLFNFVV